MDDLTPTRRRGLSIGIALDWFFFVVAGVAAVWLAYLSLTESFKVGWWGIVVAIVFWILLAYLVLPRLHRILTTIYVPDYFIGRTRTSDGLLGDPVNLALMGDAAEIEAVLEKAGWTRADPVTLASSWRIVVSTLTRRSYDEAPVSPLFLFGRSQDFAYQQEVAGNPAQRHHVRFWRCPEGWLLPGGRRVDWVAAGTFDRAVGLSLFTLQVTHRIDADTDIERDHIVSTLTAVDDRIAVDVIEDFATGYHARNGGGDSIRTDGDLPILDMRPLAAPAPQPVAQGAPAPRVATTGPAAQAQAQAVVGEATAEPAPARPRTPSKRAAFEPAVQLLRPTGYDPDMTRPPSTVAGGVLVLLRVAAGVLWMVNAAIQGPAWLHELDSTIDAVDLTSAEIATGLSVALGAIGLALVVEAVFGVLILRGRNFPRVVVMIFSAASITSAFVAWIIGGQDIRITTTLLTIALDILILLALSSRGAAAYARRHEHP